MKPGDVATLLGIGRSTVSAWTSGEYREYFTLSAQGGSGRVRNLTDLDVRLLHFIDALKKASTPPEEIHVALQQLKATGWDDLPPIPDAPAGMASVPVVPSAAAESALASERRSHAREIEMWRLRVEELQSEVNSERSDKEELLRELGEAQAELRLWRSGRLKPEE
jgi:DNA-binding transcriptional MerR regulator